LMLVRRIRPEQPWYLEGLTADGKRWTIPVSTSPFVIGRGEYCDLSLLDRTVSRRHAEICYDGPAVYIRDLDSTNGTCVNDATVRGRVLLQSGDTVDFGGIRFRILSSEEKGRDSRWGTVISGVPARRESFASRYNLTRRQEEVLTLLLQGRSSRAIADELCVSFGTAKNHVFNIMQKTGVHSRFELITLYNGFAARYGT
jgi:DNA-binding CsgD family transcriptional regulator